MVINKFLGGVLKLAAEKLGSKAAIEQAAKKLGSCEAKSSAFTLVEVLITLVIIGVVSALVIQSLVIKYQKMQTVSQLKKEYSVFYNAYRMSVDENGPTKTWNFSTSTIDFYKKYLSPYVKDQICTTNSGKCARYSYAQCPTCASYYTFSTNVVLDDGTTMYFYWDNGLRINIDLNGSKKPNRMGKDIFVFGINSSKTMKETFGFFCQWCGSYGTIANTTRANWLNTCKPSYTPSCGGLIQYDGWQIKDDYPW